MSVCCYKNIKIKTSKALSLNRADTIKAFQWLKESALEFFVLLFYLHVTSLYQLTLSPGSAPTLTSVCMLCFVCLFAFPCQCYLLWNSAIFFETKVKIRGLQQQFP